MNDHDTNISITDHMSWLISYNEHCVSTVSFSTLANSLKGIYSLITKENIDRHACNLLHELMIMGKINNAPEIEEYRNKLIILKPIKYHVNWFKNGIREQTNTDTLIQSIHTIIKHIKNGKQEEYDLDLLMWARKEDNNAYINGQKKKIIKILATRKV